MTILQNFKPSVSFYLPNNPHSLASRPWRGMCVGSQMGPWTISSFLVSVWPNCSVSCVHSWKATLKIIWSCGRRSQINISDDLFIEESFVWPVAQTWIESFYLLEEKKFNQKFLLEDFKEPQCCSGSLKPVSFTKWSMYIYFLPLLSEQFRTKPFQWQYWQGEWKMWNKWKYNLLMHCKPGRTSKKMSFPQGWLICDAGETILCSCGRKAFFPLSALHVKVQQSSKNNSNFWELFMVFTNFFAD